MTKNKMIKSAERWASDLWKESNKSWQERKQDHNYRNLIVRPALKEAVSGLETITGGIFLDVGCGEGEETNYLWNFLKSSGFNGAMFGYDLQNHFFETAREKYPAIRFLNRENLENVIAKENLAGKVNLGISQFALQETPDVNRLLSDISSCLIDCGTAIFVLVHPKFGEAMKQKGALKTNLNLGSEYSWQFAAEYPIVEERGRTFFVPYFHRSLENYFQLMRSYFLKFQFEELKPSPETIKKCEKDHLSPFYNHPGNVYYPEIVEMASSLIIMAEK